MTAAAVDVRSGAAETPAAWMPLRTALGAAFVVTLTRPASWAFGLAGFLAGGGLVVLAWPILVLPTPTGLQNALGGPVSSLVFGSPSPELVLLIVASMAGFLAAVVVGTMIGAWAERQGIVLALQAAADEGLAPPAPDLAGAPGPTQIAAIRLLALVPVTVALLLAWRPIYDTAYRELILPTELVTPLPIRVMRELPLLIAAVLAVWLVSDAAAAIAVRRLVLERRRILAAWLLGWSDLVRRPHRVLGTALAGTGVMVVQIVPVLLVASVGWTRVREVLVDGHDPLLVAFTVATWVAVWLGGLVLAGVTAAFRSAAWTFEPPRSA